jgi:hypothetical protein
MISESVQEFLPHLFALIGLLMVLKSFSERRHAQLSWMLIIMNHFWVALAISFNENFSFDQVHIYLSGIVFPPFLISLPSFAQVARREHWPGSVSWTCIQAS